MNNMQNPIGQTAQFQQTWEALMRTLSSLLSLANFREPNRTQYREAVSIAKHHLAKIEEML